MSRYYFDLLNGDGPTRDDEGVELAGRSEVLSYIRRLLVDLVRDEVLGDEKEVSSLTVRDENDKVVASASLSVNTEWLDEANR